MTSLWDELRFGLWYDFRNPSRQPFTAFYEETLRQIEWAEGLGFSSAWLTEHHFVDDGYTPSPLVLSAAILERTEAMRVGTNLMLLPLHDPVRLAEDAATLSLLSSGRFALGVAIGYRELEFDAFGRSIRHRPSLLEEGVELIRRAWAGETIDFDGKRFSYPPLHVTPQPEGPLPLLIGGMSEPACDRVARIGNGFLSTINDHQLMYFEGLRKAGLDPADGRVYAGQWAIIDDDPERTWARIGEHALYQINMYIEWGAFGPPDQVPQFETPEQLLEGGPFWLWDADAAVSGLTQLLTERPQIRDVHFWAQLPGESIESGSARLEFIANRVLPRVRQAIDDWELETANTTE